MKRFASRQIAVLAVQLKQNLQAASRRQDEEAIHKMRVSIRRYVQSLVMFEDYLPPGRSKKVWKQLRPLLRRSSKVRDLDVAILFLKKHREDAGVLVKRREKAVSKLADALSSGNWQSRLDWSDEKAPVSKVVSVREHVREKLPPLAADFFAAGRKAMKPKRTWAEMHDFRLAAKQFRYTLELFRPVFGKLLEKRLEAVRELQQFLGDINDAVSSRKLLKEVEDADSLREKLSEKAQSKRKELVSYWAGVFDAPGELEKWENYLKMQQKVRARS